MKSFLEQIKYMFYLLKKMKKKYLKNDFPNVSLIQEYLLNHTKIYIIIYVHLSDNYTRDAFVN